jgi:hypothetical protein
MRTPDARTVKRYGLILGLVLVCVVSWLSIARTVTTSSRPKDPGRAFVCEACAHRFRHAALYGPQRCPKCGKPEGALSHTFHCAACDVTFELYRSRLPEAGRAAMARGDRSPELDAEYPPEVKPPDGDTWIPATDARATEVRRPTCPKCGARAKRAR